MKGGRKLRKIAVITVIVAVVATAVYLMAHSIGLAPGLDFGAGAYFYADIPDFEKYIEGGSYKSNLPLWLATVLFLVWGFLMYKLWCRIDGKH